MTIEQLIAQLRQMPGDRELLMRVADGLEPIRREFKAKILQLVDGQIDRMSSTDSERLEFETLRDKIAEL